MAWHAYEPDGGVEGKECGRGTAAAAATASHNTTRVNILVADKQVKLIDFEIFKYRFLTLLIYR